MPKKRDEKYWNIAMLFLCAGFLQKTTFFIFITVLFWLSCDHMVRDCLATGMRFKWLWIIYAFLHFLHAAASQLVMVSFVVVDSLFFFFLFFLFSLCQKNHTVLLIFNYLTVFLLIIDVKSMHLFFHTDCVLFPFLVFLPFKAENMCKKRKHQRRNNWINNEESLCVALCILQMTPC